MWLYKNPKSKNTISTEQLFVSFTSFLCINLMDTSTFYIIHEIPSGGVEIEKNTFFFDEKQAN